jgi:hypothetical protein
MAKVTNIPVDSAGSLPPGPLRPGRKRKPYDYSQFKKAFRNTEDFAFFLAGYPDMSGVLAYWYRLYPKIDLSRIGHTETNLVTTTKVSEMTEEYAAATWGSGKYMLKFTDANRAANQQEVARVWFTVDDPALPAKYDPRCLLLNDPVNADEVARLLASGVLVREGEYGSPVLKTAANAAPAVAVAPPSPVFAPAPVLSGSLGDQLLVKLLDRALPLVAPTPTAGEFLQQSFQIADRFRQMDSPAAPSLDQIADAVAKRLPPAPVASSFTTELETYERVGVLLDKVGAGRSLNGAVEAALPGWAVFLGPVLDEFVKPLVPVLVNYLMRPAAPVPRGPVLVAGSGSAAEPPPPPPRLVLLPADAPLMDRARQVASLALAKCREDISGDQFAAWVCGFYPGGREIFDMFERAGGTQSVIGFLAMDSQLGPLMRDPVVSARLTPFLDEFTSYSPGDDDDDEEEDEEELPLAAVAPA